MEVEVRHALVHAGRLMTCRVPVQLHELERLRVLFGKLENVRVRHRVAPMMAGATRRETFERLLVQRDTDLERGAALLVDVDVRASLRVAELHRRAVTALRFRRAVAGTGE